MRIKKEKFTLRPWSREDFSSLAENANNIKIWRNVRDSFPHPYTEQDALSYIESVFLSLVVYDFAIEINNKAVGGVGIVPGEDETDSKNAEIGYWLGERYWNWGIMTDVIKAIVEYTFTYTGIIRLFATVFEYNIASMRVLEKAGFKKLAIFTKAGFKNNQFINTAYYELVKEE